MQVSKGEKRLWLTSEQDSQDQQEGSDSNESGSTSNDNEDD